MSKLILDVQNVSKYFYIWKSRRSSLKFFKAFFDPSIFKCKVWSLKNITFQLFEGDHLGIIGSNGAGKTTLLRVLSNILSPNKGGLVCDGKMYALFYNFDQFSSELSLDESIHLFLIYYGHKKSYIKTIVDDILLEAGLVEFKLASIKELSLGQKQRLMVVLFFYANGDIFAFDESFHFIDRLFSEYCHKKVNELKQKNKLILIASHDHDIIMKYCKKVVWLEYGVIKQFGNTKEVLAEYDKKYC